MWEVRTVWLCGDAAAGVLPPLDKAIQLIVLRVLEVGTPMLEVKEWLERLRQGRAGSVKIVVTYGAGRCDGAQWLRATHCRLWGRVFDEQIRKFTLHHVPPQPPVAAPFSPPAAGTYDSIAFGGSLDGCHDGHCLVLFFCFQLLRRRGHSLLCLALMQDEWLRGKDEAAKLLAYPYPTRATMLMDYATALATDFGYDADGDTDGDALVLRDADGNTLRIELSQIGLDGVGIAGTDPRLECLVVSEETVKGAQVVNDCRVGQHGLPPLKVEVCPLVTRNRDKISSRNERLDLIKSRHIDVAKVGGEFARSILAVYDNTIESSQARAAVEAALVDDR